MKILLAEDDRKLGSYLKKLFINYGNELDLIDKGSDIEYYAQNGEYDILILDWMLPGKDGIDACTDLRSSGYQGGIIMLTARAELADKITGLKCGADDYLAKPFDFEELYARTKALHRRTSQIYKHDVFTVGSCTFNCTEKTAFCSDFTIRLTNKEFQLVELLARNAGHAVTRELLLDRVWGMEKEVSSNSLDVYMRLVRKKFDQITNKVFIHNVRTVGYRWEEKDV